MKKLLLVLALVLALALVLVVGLFSYYGEVAQGWAKAPDSFMGLKFGQSLPGQMKKCPTDRYFVVDGQRHYMIDYEKQGKEPCYVPVGLRVADFYNAPNIGFLISIPRIFRTDKDAFEGMYFMLAHSDYNKMKQLLLAQYGAPTRIENEKITTMGGAVLNKEYLRWEAPDLTLALREYTDDINQSFLTIYTRAFAEFAQSWGPESDPEEQGQAVMKSLSPR